MSWGNFSVSGRRDAVRTLESMILEAVTYFRNRGHKNEHAIEQTALALEVTPRRVKSFLYSEAFATSEDEFDRIRGAFLRHLDAQADDLAARSEAARAKRRQMELGI
jgi:hypothetical protein